MEKYDKHRDIESDAFSLRFLDFVRSRNAVLEHAAIPEKDMPRFLRGVCYPDLSVHPWPTFVDQHLLERFKRATVDVTALVKSIPGRLFNKSPKAFADFYGVVEAKARRLMTPPTGIKESFCRCDFVHSPGRFMCLEVNVGSTLEGWQVHALEELFERDALVAAFREKEGLELTTVNPLSVMFQQIIRDVTLKNIPRCDEINIAIVVDPHIVANLPKNRSLTAYFKRVYRVALRASGLEGTVFFCAYPFESTERDGRYYVQGLQIHAVLENTEVPSTQSIVDVFQRGLIIFYNAPMCLLLGDKRNIALLSMHAEQSDLFNQEEQKTIQDHIPWTRILTPGKTNFGNRGFRLPEDLYQEPAKWVLKKALSYGGSDVHIGKHVAPDKWIDFVEAHTREGGWIVQQYHPSIPYLYHAEGKGIIAHDVIWGMFCFDNLFGGGYLRMVPCGTADGVINSARGATEGFLYQTSIGSHTNGL